jgi:hypothetical protein
MENLTLSHGEWVRANKFAVGDFARGFSTRIGPNGYFGGTWDELEALVEAHRDDFEPGTGSVDNDVILVNVPPANFFTSVVLVDESNAHLVREEFEARRPGEEPVVSRRITGVKPPAAFVKIVCYRADVLARDEGRTTDAEWEIVAVLAQLDEVTPMTPSTMHRNANHDEGGTYREYTEREWADAYAYWGNHAFVEEL